MMANQEHLELLKRGVEQWNAWRRQHPEIQPELEGVNLSHANLDYADLRAADLRRADRSHAILTCAKLNNALQLHF